MIDSIKKFINYVVKKICACFRHCFCNSSCVDKCNCGCSTDEDNNIKK